jgi:hypothetical protein
MTNVAIWTYSASQGPIGTDDDMCSVRRQFGAMGHPFQE